MFFPFQLGKKSCTTQYQNYYSFFRETWWDSLVNSYSFYGEPYVDDTVICIAVVVFFWCPRGRGEIHVFDRSVMQQVLRNRKNRRNRFENLLLEIKRKKRRFFPRTYIVALCKRWETELRDDNLSIASYRQKDTPTTSYNRSAGCSRFLATSVFILFSNSSMLVWWYLVDVRKRKYFYVGVDKVQIKLHSKQWKTHVVLVSMT